MRIKERTVRFEWEIKAQKESCYTKYVTIKIVIIVMGITMFVVVNSVPTLHNIRYSILWPHSPNIFWYNGNMVWFNRMLWFDFTVSLDENVETSKNLFSREKNIHTQYIKHLFICRTKLNNISCAKLVLKRKFSWRNDRKKPLLDKCDQ